MSPVGPATASVPVVLGQVAEIADSSRSSKDDAAIGFYEPGLDASVGANLVHAPELRLPKAGMDSLVRDDGTPQDPWTLVAEFMELLEDLKQSKRRDSYGGLQTRLSALKSGFEARSKAFQQAATSYEHALKDAAQRGGDLRDAQEQVKRGQGEVDRLEQVLAETVPASDEYNHLRGELSTAAQALADARIDEQTQSGLLRDAMDTLELSSQELDRSTQDLKGGGDVIQPPTERLVESAEALLGELQAIFSQIVAKAQTTSIKEELKREQTRLEAQVAENKRRSDDFVKKIEEARRRERAMGIFAKVFGWVLTVVSVLLAPITGGASLAFAAIGLALTVAEELGVNVVGEAMNAVMEKVIKPLAEAIGEAIGKVLEKLGIENAEKVAQIMGMVIATVMIVVAAVAGVLVAKSMVKQLLSKLMQMAGKLYDKLAGSLLKAAVELGRRLAKESVKNGRRGLSQLTGISGETAAKFAGHAVTAASLAGAGASVVQTGFAVDIAVRRKESTDLEGEISQSIMESAQVRKLMERALDRFSDLQTKLDEVQESLADMRTRGIRMSQNLLTSRLA